MTIKEFEVQKKAKELTDMFCQFVQSDDGDRYDLCYSEEIEFKNMKSCAIAHINEIVKLLESIPKLTVCEIEGQKCYGIIDFYKDVRTELERRQKHYT
jgi:hypothetical protein